MKRYFLLLLFLCTLTTCNQKNNRSNQGKTGNEDTTALQTDKSENLYADWKVIDKADYSLHYPKDWIKKTDMEDTEFFIYSPQTDTEDLFRENISLVIEDLKGTGYGLNKYVKAALKTLKKNIIESKRIRKAGRDCQMIVYTQDFPDKYTIKSELYIWVKNERAYILAFGYVIEENNPMQQAGNEIIRTFKLK